MIPAKFDYLRPETVDSAVSTLGDVGEEAKVIAGGQSLIPLLRLRLTNPSVLVDIGSLAELSGVVEEGDTVTIGTLTTLADLMKDDVVRRDVPLLAAAAATIADRQVRNRATLGGALAHADPAGDLPAVALALDAEFVVLSPNGHRVVAAEDFFLGYLETALGPDELLVEVRIRRTGEGWGVHYEKFHRTAQAWAIVGVAAAVRREGDSIVDAKVALTNMGLTPVRARAVEAALAGVAADAQSIERAAGRAVEGTSALSDGSAQADYREHLARVLTARAILKAAALD